MCETDEVLLARILGNLLENAIKYTPTGRIAVRAHPVEVAAADADAAHWAISVEDTGIGIPEAEHQRVFEEFYQLHNPERKRLLHHYYNNNHQSMCIPRRDNLSSQKNK